MFNLDSLAGGLAAQSAHTRRLPTASAADNPQGRGHHGLSIAGKLYLIAAMAAASIVAIGLLAVVYVRALEVETRRFEADAVLGVVLAADLVHMLERHRRLVESARAGASAGELARDLRRAESLSTRILAITRNSRDVLLSRVSRSLTVMAHEAKRVLSPGHRNQDGGLQAYKAAAAEASDAIMLYRDRLRAEAGERLTAIVDRGNSLISRVGLVVGLALLGVIPFCLYLARNVASRLIAMAATMRRLAENDIAVSIPSSGDHDEVGEMARAIEVFKSNAIEIRLQHADNVRLTHLLDIALNNMARGLSMFDADRRLVLCNRVYRDMYGIPDDVAVPGASFETVVRGANVAVFDGDEAHQERAIDRWAQSHQTMLAKKRTFTTQHWLKDGRIVSIVCRPLDGGGWVDVHEDVTEKERTAERIVQMAERDAMTGLFNRRSFYERLGVKLRRGADAPPFAVLWIDIDRFKAVNDTYGHPVGDELLKAVAKTIRRCVRGTDFVARLGGDEFAIIAEGESLNRQNTGKIAARIVGALAEPFAIAGHTLEIGASVGVAWAPEDGTTPDEIMKCADIALYGAKAAGRGRSLVFDRAMERDLKQRSLLQLDLRQAIARGELSLHYQPILDVEPQGIVSFEALLRWQHGNLGPISPADFIPLAEESGYIGQLGAWVLETACAEACSWPEDISVSVNLSAAQFRCSDVGRTVRTALEVSGLAPHRLQLEVTESLAMDQRHETWAILHELKALGISIALDDFGTGYSSLSYLRRFPFDTIKIDRAFVMALDDGPDNLVFIRAIAALADALGMSTIAEGVESASHLAHVKLAGCTGVQGYHFSRPVPAHAVAGLLSNNLDTRRVA